MRSQLPPGVWHEEASDEEAHDGYARQVRPMVGERDMGLSHIVMSSSAHAISSSGAQ